MNETADGALSRAQLASLAGCSEARAAAYEALGLLEAGSGYGAGDVSRLKLILALEESGVDPETLAEALRRQGLSLDFARQLIFEPIPIAAESLEAVLARTGADFALVNRLRAAAGYAALMPGRALHADDVDLIESVAACSALGVSEAALARVLRSFSQALRRTAETMRDLFRNEIEEPMLNAGLGYDEMLDRSAGTRLALQQQGFRTLLQLQRRILEDAVFDNIVVRVQERLRLSGHALRRPDTPSVVFADLSDFTNLTASVGDAAAAEQATGFEALAQQTAAANGGRIVKSLGDGVMMLFPDSASAVATALALAQQAADAALPPVRTGIATGHVIHRDGDIFGQTVNLAARLSGAATAGQVLACEVTHANAAASHRFVPLAALSLKGFREPVPAYAAV